MERRVFLGTLAGLLAAPLAAMAQTAATRPRIGMLGNNAMDPAVYETFKQGLAQVGFTERQVVIVSQHAAGVPSRVPARAADLIRDKVDVILARGPVALAAAVEASKTIPIVALDLESDPIALGYAKTLARPGGNVTGVFLDLPELSAKQLQLFQEIVPGLSRAALVGDPIGNAAQFRVAERTAETLGVKVQAFEGRTAAELDAAMEAARRNGAGAVIIFSSPIVFDHRARIAVLGREKQLPTVSLFTEFAEAGGLLTYGPSIRESARRAGVFVGKILNGVKPAELPIERPEKFELVINLKTSKALGLTIPQSLLLRADRVIE
jgi:putative tryptophan/tyrosine transport system substrate-binding protein